MPVISTLDLIDLRNMAIRRRSCSAFSFSQCYCCLQRLRILSIGSIPVSGILQISLKYLVTGCFLVVGSERRTTSNVAQCGTEDMVDIGCAR